MSVCWHVQVHVTGEISSASLLKLMAEENRKVRLLDEQMRRDVADGDYISDWYRRRSTVSEQHVGARTSSPCPPDREAACSNPNPNPNPHQTRSVPAPASALPPLVSKPSALPPLISKPPPLLVYKHTRTHTH